MTHSDTIIREAVGRGAFSVFHMQSAGIAASEGQATPIRASLDLERGVIDLVGDLAAYRPGAKIVIFESTEGAAFDATMVRKIFPEFDRYANVISAGEKRRVAGLYELLEQMRTQGQLHLQCFAITDPDDDEPTVGPRRLQRLPDGTAAISMQRGLPNTS